MQLGDSVTRRIFDVVVAAYPNQLAQKNVAAAAGLEFGGGTWRTFIAELRSLGLVEGRGELRMAEDLV